MNEMTDTHILAQYLDYRETVSLEAATNPVAAAYGNAIYNAIGVRFYELPITPERILSGLRGQAGK